MGILLLMTSYWYIMEYSPTSILESQIGLPQGSMLVVFFLYQTCYLMVYHHFQIHPCLEHVESLDKIINRNYSKFYVWGSTWTEMSLAQFWWGICQWFTLPRSSPEAGSSYQCGDIVHQKYFLIFFVLRLGCHRELLFVHAWGEFPVV